MTPAICYVPQRDSGSRDVGISRLI
ncbi:rCG23200 [Rattus norvegicus]|uniref:RCG23200 n=1 Tax=Rattus norvegicus TaxID=10116 RepID=A6JQ35_RAT|nr:rCG23200 [Rattus norvegicus]